MQYENNLKKKSVLQKKKKKKLKKRFGFQKAFFPEGTSGKRGVVL